VRSYRSRRWCWPKGCSTWAEPCRSPGAPTRSPTGSLRSFLFRLALYGSGVLYSVDRFIASGLGQAVLDLGPLYGYLSMARWAIMGDAVSSTALAATAVGWTVPALVVGSLTLVAGEQEYADE